VRSLRFDIFAVGVLAPGIGSLQELLDACRSGRLPEPTAPLALPGPAMLPPNERRRASQVVRLTLACIEQALRNSPFPAEKLRSVFATDEGTGEVCQQLLDGLATTRQVSPLVFPNSVHNAPAGYFSIAWRSRQPATVVSLGLESFASGLLCATTESKATGAPVLFVAYDPAMTAPVDEQLPVRVATATAWVLGADGLAGAVPVLGSFQLELGPAGKVQPTALPSWLPPDWHANSSAHALAALALLEADTDTGHRLTLGGQLLALRRVGGARA
jgi:hypothetical protein